jgi:N-acetylmuramoyl-L-alanine amidase
MQSMTGVLMGLIMAAWPALDARVSMLETPFPRGRALKVFVDAGHGAPNNRGNTGCYCQKEQDHTLAVARHLAFVLSTLGPFDVRLSRSKQPSKYQSRIAAAEAWQADAIVSIHSDARGVLGQWSPFGGEPVCLRNTEAPGFSVLWNDEGQRDVVEARARLARAVGRRLRGAGFRPYDGSDYQGLYRHDAEELSGWIDDRPTDKRVYFLRASKIPSIIIETHHAMDPQEVLRWEDGRTVDAFALAVAQALRESLATER